MNTIITTYANGTPPAVKGILESAIHTGERLRLFYGDQNTGQDWHEEYNTAGAIGRSGGTVRVPLLLENRRSSGGGAILTACIVKITKNGRTLYEHPNYHHGRHTLGPVQTKGYSEAVYRDGELVAQFKNRGQGQKWIDFIEGRRDSE